MKLSIGTAQLGIEYGIASNNARVSNSEARKILSFASKNGIQNLDTAPTYGEVEKFIGRYDEFKNEFQISSKTINFSNLEIDKNDISRLEAVFFKSLENLKLPKINCLLVHHGKDLLKPGGEKIFHKLREFKNAGKVKKIGASVYSKLETVELLKRYELDVLQVPISIADQRLLKNNFLMSIQQSGIEIHARSIFLQGALLMPTDMLPPHLSVSSAMFKLLQADADKANISTLDACICFIKSLGFISHAVIGTHSVKQLAQIIHSSNQEHSLQNYSKYCINDENVVNPSLWPKIQTET